MEARRALTKQQSLLSAELRLYRFQTLAIMQSLVLHSKLQFYKISGIKHLASFEPCSRDSHGTSPICTATE